jgi:hypothetical protein
VPLFLHLDVDVERPDRLLRHYDLENYLTPLFGSRALPPQRFVYVSARKFVGGGSRIICGRAKTSSERPDGAWSSFSCNAGAGASTRRWKECVRDALSAACVRPIPPGQARVRLAWRCSTRRNWVTLWKPTGDAMGPVLGVSHPRHPFNPDDDRITELELHLNPDNALRHDVNVGMWWRAVSDPPDRSSAAARPSHR